MDLHKPSLSGTRRQSSSCLNAGLFSEMVCGILLMEWAWPSFSAVFK